MVLKHAWGFGVSGEGNKNSMLFLTGYIDKYFISKMNNCMLKCVESLKLFAT